MEASLRTILAGISFISKRRTIKLLKRWWIKMFKTFFLTIVSLFYSKTALFCDVYLTIWHKQLYVFSFWRSGWMQAAPHPSLYPCAVTDNMLGPVQIDIINKRTRGGSGQSPSYFAEWKTFLLTWTQQSRPSFPETEFAASLVKHFFTRKSKDRKHNFVIHRNSLKTWKQMRITGTQLFFYKPMTFTHEIRMGSTCTTLEAIKRKLSPFFSAARCYRMCRIYS